MKKLGLIASLLLTLSIAAQTKVTKTFPSFHAIEISGAYEVFFRLGDKHEVVIVAHGNDHKDVQFDLSDGELKIDSENSLWNDSKPIQLYITAKKLDKIDLSGAVSFISKNTIKGDFIKIDLSGAASLELEAMVSLINIDGSGGCEIFLSGSTDKLAIDMSGASSLEADKLKANEVTLELSGACSADIFAKEVANLELSGAARLTLRGPAEIGYKEVSGSASFNRN